MSKRILPSRVSQPFITELHEFNRGKVRDSYDLPDSADALFPVASDRISVFDFVTGSTIPSKGAILTAMNVFWRTGPLKDVIGQRHDLLAYGSQIDRHLPFSLRGFPELQKRSLVIQRKKPMNREMIVRGYLTGSGLKAYNMDRTICGHVLPDGLFDGAELPEPIFTPTTKAELSHDVHVTAQSVRQEYGDGPERLALDLYKAARDYARSRGIIIADTKFEFGNDGELCVIDEVLTPDSSRFWPKTEWDSAQKKKKSPASLDKEFVRKYLKGFNVDLLDPEDAEHVARVGTVVLPDTIVRVTTQLYRYAFWRLVGMKPERFQREFMGIEVADRKPRIEILIGSESDRKQVEPVVHRILRGHASYRISVLSCHRNEGELEDFCRLHMVNADLGILCAGKAADLPGAAKAKLCKIGRYDIHILGVGLRGETEDDDRDARSSITGLPGQPVELSPTTGGAFFGTEGVEEACLAAINNEFMPRTIEAKPVVIGEWVTAE